MGRPPKPIEEKRRTGNPGKRALAPRSNLAAVPAVPPEAYELDPAATFDGVVEHARPWLAATDATALALLREALDERAALRDLVLLIPSNTDFRRELRALDKQIAAQMSALGLDPTARGRLGLVEVKAVSKLAELRDRRGK